MQSRARRVAPLVLACVFAIDLGDAHAIIIRDDVPDAEYVVQDADYPAVVTLFPPDDCAGTLIHASHVLTVAHCAVDLANGDALEVNGVEYIIDEITLHPMWTDDDPYDIAVVRFQEPVMGVEPVPMYRGADELGSVVTLVGRGVTATGLVGESGGSSDGRLRRATNIVSAVDDHLIEVVFERPDEAGVTDLEGVGASGDSGGPVFIEVDGAPHLAGLNAFGDAPNGVGIGEYGAWDYQTRVSRYAEWVDGVIDAGSSSDASGSSSGTDSSGSSTEGSTEPDATSGSGGAGATPAEDGCGCTQGRVAPVLALLAIAIRRRRRACTGDRARRRSGETS